MAETTTTDEKRDARSGFLSLPRVHVRDLSYSRFLTEFALPRKPFILMGASERWPARKWTLESINNTVRRSQCKVDGDVRFNSGDGIPAQVNCDVTEPLRTMFARAKQAPAERVPPSPMYVTNIQFARRGSGLAELEKDLTVPRYFDASPSFLATNLVLFNSAENFKWLYVGEEGTSTMAHIDTLNSSAWLFVVSGRKEWLCVHGDDLERLVPGDVGGKLQGRSPAEHRLFMKRLFEQKIDLFAPDVFERFPHLRDLRIYHGFQGAGDICFNPTYCFHQVRNLAFSIGLTHNYIDATNLGAVLQTVNLYVLQPYGFRWMAPFSPLLAPAVRLVLKGVLRDTLGDDPHIYTQFFRDASALPAKLADEAAIDDLIEHTVAAAAQVARACPRGCKTRGDAFSACVWRLAR
eukprot:964777-Prymnesium_polylepis.1